MNLDYFLDIEKRYNLLKKKIDTFDFWVYLRTEIWWYILIKSYGWEAVNPKKENNILLDRISKYIMMIYNVLAYSLVHRDHHDVLIITDGRRVWEKDHYECIYCDELASEMKNSVVLEDMFEQRHFRPVNTKNLYYSDIIEIKAYIHYHLSRFFNRREFFRNKNKIYEMLREPIRDLESVYDVKINSDDILKLALEMYYKYKSKKKSYQKLINRTSPRVIIETCGYSVNAKTVNEVAKENKISVIELQHGTMNEDIGYSYPEGVAIKQFPDYLFVFSEFWKMGNCFPIKNEKIIPVGFPYLERQRKIYPPKKEKEKTVILFLSQPIVAKKLAEMAIDLLHLLSPEKYKIIFKLHPNQYSTWKEKLKELSDIKEIEVIADNRRSLYEFLAQADIQVGYTSTSLYEGLSYNLDTYIFRMNNNHGMEDLIEAGYACEFTSAIELAELIGNNTLRNGKKPERLWTENAIKNMLGAIDSIMAQG